MTGRIDPALVAWLRGLTSEVGERLAHLLTCSLCRLQALGHLPLGQGAVRAACQEAPIVYSAIWPLLDPERALAVQRIAGEYEAVLPLLAELLGLPADERRERVNTDPRCLSYTLAQHLIDLALAPPAGETGAPFARLALDIASRLASELADTPRVSRDLVIAAHINLGEALREEGDLAAAEAEFLNAARELASALPADDDTRAAYCQYLAALRREQDRIEEALALFGHAADLWRDLGEREAEAWTYLELGELALVEALDPARALAAFDTAAAVPGLAERQAFLAFAGTIRSLAALNRPDEALEELALERNRFTSGSKEAFELQALEGHLERQLERPRLARDRLLQAFRGLVRLGAYREAVMAGVELLQILTSSAPRRHPLPRITATLLDLAEKLAPEVQEAIRFCLAHAVDPRFPRLLRSLADYLQRSRLRSRLVFREDKSDGHLPVN